MFGDAVQTAAALLTGSLPSDGPRQLPPDAPRRQLPPVPMSREDIERARASIVVESSDGDIDTYDESPR